MLDELFNTQSMDGDNGKNGSNEENKSLIQIIYKNLSANFFILYKKRVYSLYDYYTNLVFVHGTQYKTLVLIFFVRFV